MRLQHGAPQLFHLGGVALQLIHPRLQFGARMIAFQPAVGIQQIDQFGGGRQQRRLQLRFVRHLAGGRKHAIQAEDRVQV